MSFEVDGNIDVAILFSKEESGAAFGPDIDETWQGSRTAITNKRDELKLDERGIAYQVTRVGSSPLWHLIIHWTLAESQENPSSPTWETDRELPIIIAWRLTAEFAEIDFFKLGRYEQMMNDSLTGSERRDLTALLKGLLDGTGTSSPSWIPTKPPAVQALINELIARYERGKGTTHVHNPILVRDATFRAGANYRAKIGILNILFTSAELISTYPEIPQQFRDRMPTNGWWKNTTNDWNIRNTGEGQETLNFVWAEWWDPEDNLKMTMPP